ncbi:hypothetical protein JW930_01595 [Candidatus Woesearchaeota archaeon]|nr:hypothetical protein [Candidatus Woesearchaeota archaeon]
MFNFEPGSQPVFLGRRQEMLASTLSRGSHELPLLSKDLAATLQGYKLKGYFGGFI